MTKILLVDDEPSILQSTTLLLREFGFEVVAASDHDVVADVIQEERPDLLLQDVRMPGLDIGVFLDRLRREPAGADLPVLLFSASIDLDVLRERVGAAGYLEKPFRPEDALRAIDDALAGRKAAT